MRKMKFTKWTVALIALLVPASVYAVRALNASGVDLGTGIDTIKCSTNLTCTKAGKVLNMVATSASLALDSGETIVNTTDDTVGVLSNDEAIVLNLFGFEAKDATLTLSADQGDDAADAFSFTSGATNGLTVKNGSTTLATVSTVGDWVFSGTTPYLTVGDAGAEDTGLAFDGNAVDFNISLDDSIDTLVLGVGTAAGTTDAIRINGTTQIVTFVQGVAGLGTDSLSGFLQAQVASTTTAITADQCGSTFVSNSADVMVLPEASTVLGCRLTFVCGTADDFDVDPADGTDTILPTGALTPSAGDAIRCTDAGAGFVLEAVGANSWAVLSTNLTITDVN
jgi:hypothetical protein